MGIFLDPSLASTCCLCGSFEDLTGEHKIKASALRDQFGTSALAIGSHGATTKKLRFAQSAKSKALHFKARLCAKCNNERTQAADREFDRFHSRVKSHFEAGRDPTEVFDEEEYKIDGEPYLNVFRYFAKLLCCHVAEVGGPRRKHVARFALGEVSQNCVWLQIKSDWQHRQLTAEFGSIDYAAHGGLVIYGKKSDGSPTAFHSTLTVGPIQYVFHSNMTWFEKLELKWLHPKFHSWCVERAGAAIREPMDEVDLRRLGLAQDDEDLEPQ